MAGRKLMGATNETLLALSEPHVPFLKCIDKRRIRQKWDKMRHACPTGDVPPCSVSLITLIRLSKNLSWRAERASGSYYIRGVAPIKRQTWQFSIFDFVVSWGLAFIAWR
jgi:hypothetical protein